jgi:hypothetical protein
MRYLILAALLSTTAFAADLPNKKKSMVAPAPLPSFALCNKPPAPANAPASTVASLPGGDVFGYSSSTEVGEVGDCAVAFEYSARLGKRDGSFYYGTLKNQYAATIASNLLVAVSPFVSHSRISSVTGYPNMSTLDFDGISGEFVYRVLERSSTNPIAIAISNETRWARLDGLFGNRVAKNIGTEFKLFADAVIMKDTLFAALNLNYGLTSARGTAPGSLDTPGSYTSASLAMTYQATDKLFVGAELRHLRAYFGNGMNTLLGSATFFGPTLMYKITDTLTFNTVWTPQVSGKATGVSGNLDLDNFERHQFRFKLVKAF